MCKRTGYAAPQFERAAAEGHGWERLGIGLRQALSLAERIPVVRVLLSVSILKAYAYGDDSGGR